MDLHDYVLGLLVEQRLTDARLRGQRHALLDAAGLETARVPGIARIAARTIRSWLAGRWAKPVGTEPRATDSGRPVPSAPADRLLPPVSPSARSARG